MMTLTSPSALRSALLVVCALFAAATSAIARPCPTGYIQNAPGSGAGAEVDASTILPNGNLIVAGWFTTVGSITANYIARWDGSSWSALGSGVNGQVYTVVTMPNGDVVAGGSFTSAGGAPASNIARWNGSSWSALGAGFNKAVQSLAVMPNGDLIAAGQFSTSGSTTVNLIARWDGSSWSALGNGLRGQFSVTNVRCLLAMPSGAIIAGGDFIASGSVSLSGIGSWDGSAWSPLGSGVSSNGTSSGSVSGLARLPNGNIVASGVFRYAGGVLVNYVARWDGTAWFAMGPGFDDGSGGPVVVLPGGDPVVGGNFQHIGGAAIQRIARWNGSSWSALGTGMNGVVETLTVMADGELFSGGNFTFAGGYFANRMAQYSFGGVEPTIDTPPGAQTVCMGGPASLSVSASGNGLLTYQWRFGGVPIDTTANPSASTPTLTVSSAYPANSGAYDCIVSNACGSTPSVSANLTVLPDITHDGTVNTMDLGQVLNTFGQSTSPFTGGDANGDGVVNSLDLGLVLTGFGKSC